MNPEKCASTINEYLSLDRNSRVPLHITMHLLNCKDCRRRIKLLAMADKAASAPLNVQVPVTDTAIENVMRTLKPELPEKSLINPVPMHNWIFFGILMILCMLVFAVFTKETENDALEVAYCLVFAACVIVYCALFVICNIDFFVKRMRTQKKAA